MEDVVFKALCKGSNPQSHSAYPDTGAEKLMVSENLVESLELKVEPTTKAVKAVDGGRVAYLGLSPVEVMYQGRTTQTHLSVTDKLRNEVILSKAVLEALEVIDRDFPTVKI